MPFAKIMIPNGYAELSSDAISNPKVMIAMKCNESKQPARVRPRLAGAYPPSAGVRVSLAGDRPKVTDGPFAESKEVIGG